MERGRLLEIVRSFIEWRDLALGIGSVGRVLSQLSPVADASFRGLGIPVNHVGVPVRVSPIARSE